MTTTGPAPGRGGSSPTGRSTAGAARAGRTGPSGAGRRARREEIELAPVDDEFWAAVRAPSRTPGAGRRPPLPGGPPARGHRRGARLRRGHRQGPPASGAARARPDARTAGRRRTMTDDDGDMGTSPGRRPVEAADRWRSRPPGPRRGDVPAYGGAPGSTGTPTPVPDAPTGGDVLPPSATADGTDARTVARMRTPRRRGGIAFRLTSATPPPAGGAPAGTAGPAGAEGSPASAARWAGRRCVPELVVAGAVDGDGPAATEGGGHEADRRGPGPDEDDGGESISVNGHDAGSSRMPAGCASAGRTTVSDRGAGER